MIGICCVSKTLVLPGLASSNGPSSDGNSTTTSSTTTCTAASSTDAEACATATAVGTATNTTNGSCIWRAPIHTEEILYFFRFLRLLLWKVEVLICQSSKLNELNVEILLLNNNAVKSWLVNLPPPNVPPRNKGLIRPYEGKPMVNKPLIRPCFLGGYVRRGSGPGWPAMVHHLQDLGCFNGPSDAFNWHSNFGNCKTHAYDATDAATRSHFFMFFFTDIWTEISKIPD